MNPTPTHPSRPLKWAAHLTRAMLWALLGLWLLVGVTWVSLHLFIVPRIGDWRVELESLATKAVGVPVRIGHIAAKTYGLIPSFELSHVGLLDAQGREALVLGQVVVSVSARSLLSLELEQLHITQPTLDVRRTAEGKVLVAGLDLLGTPDESGDRAAVANWFFSQTEFVIQSGTVRWTDDLRQQPALALIDVNVVVRNPGRQHHLRLDATPQDELGQRFTLQGVFTSPFLTLNPGRWSQWSGTAHAHLPSVNLARLVAPAALLERFELGIDQGEGSLQMWIDVKNGHITGGTTDLALENVQARFARANQPLALKKLKGRLNMALAPETTSLKTQNLTFETASGNHWAKGDISLRLTQSSDQTQGELKATRINLTALHEISTALPLAPSQQARLSELQPQGEITALNLNWRAKGDAWPSYSAQGTVTQLALAPGKAPPPAPAVLGGPDRQLPGRPGLSGAQVTFDLNQNGGQARVAMEQGWMSFPGVFAEPQIPFDQLSGNVRWQLKGPDIKVSVKNLLVANADLQGQANVEWQTSNPVVSPSRSRLPGVIKMNGSLSRGKMARVHRYLPLVIGAEAKNYVEKAILAGRASNVRFQIKGDLWEAPFPDPTHGDLKVTAQVSGVDLAFLPPDYSAPGDLLWPALRQVVGELVLERTSLTVQVARGSVAGSPSLRVSQGKAYIANLQKQSVVEVNARIDGPLNQALDLVRRSPLSVMTAQTFAQTTGTGNVGILFGLSVPLDDALKTQVKGRITLPGNDVRLAPALPQLARLQAMVDFSDSGFQLTTTATAQLLGGELSFSGGLLPQAGGGRLQFLGQGTATAVGLANAPYLSMPPALMKRMSGGAAYSVQLGFNQGVPEWSVQSTLQGVAVDLPPPATKKAEQNWAFSYQNRVIKAATATDGAQESIHIKIAPETRNYAGMQLVRTRGKPGFQLQRGVVYYLPNDVPAPALPAQGLSAQFSMPAVDADAWLTAFEASSSTQANTSLGLERSPSWTPDRVELDTGLLKLGGQTFRGLSLVANANRTPAHGERVRWSATVQARELAGTLSYLPPNPQGALATGGNSDTRDGQLTARLQRLALSTYADNQYEGTGLEAVPAPASLPALDVFVNDFMLDGRHLGQLSLDATNRATGAANAPREWLLHKLVLRVPEAQLTASGSWALPLVAENIGLGSRDGRRRTELSVALDIDDSGALLQRFGMPGVFRGGRGSVTGSLGWLGVPGRLSTDSLDGELKLDLAAGQFLKAEPGLAKLLGVLSLQSLPRRLTLDFSDVFAQGFSFDFVRGDARIERGVVYTNNLQMKGPNAAVLLEGSADIARETQHIRALVVPELNAGTAALIATVINPAVGLGTFLAQAVLRQPLIAASSQSFLIQGPWANPQVDKLPALSATDPAYSHPKPTGKPP